MSPEDGHFQAISVLNAKGFEQLHLASENTADTRTQNAPEKHRAKKKSQVTRLKYIRRKNVAHRAHDKRGSNTR